MTSMKNLIKVMKMKLCCQAQECLWITKAATSGRQDLSRRSSQDTGEAQCPNKDLIGGVDSEDFHPEGDEVVIMEIIEVVALILVVGAVALTLEVAALILEAEGEAAIMILAASAAVSVGIGRPKVSAEKAITVSINILQKDRSRREIN